VTEKTVCHFFWFKLLTEGADETSMVRGVTGRLLTVILIWKSLSRKVLFSVIILLCDGAVERFSRNR